jgi:hypothetical protein
VLSTYALPSAASLAQIFCPSEFHFAHVRGFNLIFEENNRDIMIVVFFSYLIS